VMAGMVELIGVVLWLELTQGDTVAHQVKSQLSIERLRAAVNLGQCKPTVEGIRRFMACAQGTAQQLRREL